MINKTARKMMYILITAICVIAIIIGVYAQFFKKKEDKEEVNFNVIVGNTLINNPTQEDIKEGFKALFTNEFTGAENNFNNIEKLDETKNIVYSGIDKYTATVEDKYDISASIPMINIKGEITERYNKKTQNIFVDKINDIMQNSQINTIMDVKYTSYINNDILSVAIMASIKEGNSAQRILVQTYNYNLRTEKDVEINDILRNRELDENALNRRIKSTVKKAAEDAKNIQGAGYNVYTRNLESNIYEVQNVTNFMQGPNGELYIIYAYGNEAFTSEMDIIEI